MTNISPKTAYLTLAIGSYANNLTKEGAWCIYGKTYDNAKSAIESFALSGKAIASTTDNQMQLVGAIEALKAAMSLQKPVYLLINNKYVLDGIQKQGSKWQHNGWRGANNKPIANKEQWEELLELCKSPLITIAECSGQRHNKFLKLAQASARELIAPISTTDEGPAEFATTTTPMLSQVAGQTSNPFCTQECR